MTPNELKLFLKATLSEKQFEKLNDIFGSGDDKKISEFLYKNWKNTLPTTRSDYEYRVFLENKLKNDIQKKYLQQNILNPETVKSLDKELAKTGENILLRSNSKGQVAVDNQKLLSISEQNATEFYTKYDGAMKSIFSTSIIIPKQEIEPIINKWVDTNIQLIKNMESDAVEEIGKSIKETFLNGGRASEVEKAIKQKVQGITKTRANLIAENEILNLHAQMNIQQHKNIGVKEYIWRTQGDGVVRLSHQLLDTTIRKYSEGILPGEEIRCRCFAVPLIKWN